jgi:hypothetical protein
VIPDREVERPQGASEAIWQFDVVRKIAAALGVAL